MHFNRTLTSPFSPTLPSPPPTPCSQGPLPAARNGHTATLAKGKIFIIGGWLGSGPLAAQDCHILHVDALMWETDSEWAPPGPCNMHTADYIEPLERLFIFRGGDGSEYLNHLHALDVNTMRWSTPSVQGTPPLPRANHSSAVIDEKIFIFGGWDGRHRLNDITHFI